MAYDFAQQDTLTLADRGVPMPLIDLRSRLPLIDDDGTPLTITIHGRQSKVFRNILKQVQARRAEMQTRNQVADAATKEAEDIEILIACTVDWSFKELDAKPFPATPANIKQFWNDERFRPTREAAWTFLMSDANFLPPPMISFDATRATSSPSAVPFLTMVEPLPTASEATA